MGVPTFMYKSVKGDVIAEVFDSDEIPRGWYESPELAESKKRKPKDDNSSNDNK